jgi:hypothetical protein
MSSYLLDTTKVVMSKGVAVLSGLEGKSSILTRSAPFAYYQTMPQQDKLDLAVAPRESPGGSPVLRRYHLLIDRRRKGKLSQKDTAELLRIEETLRTIEDAEASKTMRAYEQRHDAMIQSLGELTAELRKIAVASQPQSPVPQSKAR